MDLDRLLARFVELLALGVLGAFGGIANYVYVSVKKSESFSFWLFLANLLLAAFVGTLVGQFIDIENPYRDGYIMAAGFCAYPILQVLETQVKNYLDRKYPNL